MTTNTEWKTTLAAQYNLGLALMVKEADAKARAAAKTASSLKVGPQDCRALHDPNFNCAE